MIGCSDNPLFPLSELIPKTERQIIAVDKYGVPLIVIVILLKHEEHKILF